MLSIEERGVTRGREVLSRGGAAAAAAAAESLREGREVL
jgi:hypothetical protein